MRKPVLDGDLAMTFAEDKAPRSSKRGPPKARTEKPTESRSGKVPEGDVRLTVNVREDLHVLLKVEAAQRRTTIGELLEELIEAHVGPKHGR